VHPRLRHTPLASPSAARRVLEERTVQSALAVAAVATLIILLGLFGDAVRIACLVVVALVTLMTAPARTVRGGGWWTLLAAGCAASIGGAIIAQPAETLGGLIAVIGGVLVVIAAAIGFPVGEG